MEDSSAILRSRFIGRIGQSSEDRRSGSYTFGIKTGCHGDTLGANITIVEVVVTIIGNIATIKATYSGKYTRQGWVDPCVQSGSEDRNLGGVVTFTITDVKFGRPILSELQFSDFGEVNDPNHDSNVFAFRAIRSAIDSGV
jgi:hypothetical protein